MRFPWIGRLLLGVAALATGSAMALPPSALTAEARTATSAEGIDLSGWAVDPCPGGDPEIQVFVDGRLVLRGEPSQPLAEITERFQGWPPALFPGFAARLGTEQLGEGRRQVRILARSRCGEEKILVEKAFRVPPLYRRPLRQDDLLVVAAFLALVLAGGWGLSRLQAWPGKLERVPILVLLSGLAAAALIVLAPKVASTMMRIEPGFFGPLGNWDGGWYQLIAKRGYDRLTSRAFFPLFPALLRVANLLHLSLPLVGASLSLGFSWLAARLLTRERPESGLGVLLLFSLPHAFFFSAVYTEAIFLALAAGLVVALGKERPLAAFAAGALASVTRAQGVYLALFPAEKLVRGGRRAAVAGIAGSAVGFGGWCAYLWWRTGDPFIFKAATSWFGRSRSFSLTMVLDNTLEVLKLGHTDAIANVLSLAVVLAASVGLLLERRWAEGLFSALVPLLSLATSSTTSIARYALGAFPAFLYLGSKMKPGRWAWAILGLLTALKLLFAWHFGRSFFMG